MLCGMYRALYAQKAQLISRIKYFETRWEALDIDRSHSLIHRFFEPTIKCIQQYALVPLPLVINREAVDRTSTALRVIGGI